METEKQTYKTAFGNELKKQLDRVNMSISTCAQRLGTLPGTLVKQMNGELECPTERIETLNKMLKCNLPAQTRITASAKLQNATEKMVDAAVRKEKTSANAKASEENEDAKESDALRTADEKAAKTGKLVDFKDK